MPSPRLALALLLAAAAACPAPARATGVLLPVVALRASAAGDAVLLAWTRPTGGDTPSTYRGVCTPTTDTPVATAQGATTALSLVVRAGRGRGYSCVLRAERAGYATAVAGPVELLLPGTPAAPLLVSQHVADGELTVVLHDPYPATAGPAAYISLRSTTGGIAAIAPVDPATGDAVLTVADFTGAPLVAAASIGRPPIGAGAGPSAWVRLLRVGPPEIRSLNVRADGAAATARAIVAVSMADVIAGDELRLVVNGVPVPLVIGRHRSDGDGWTALDPRAGIAPFALSAPLSAGVANAISLEARSADGTTAASSAELPVPAALPAPVVTAVPLGLGTVRCYWNIVADAVPYLRRWQIVLTDAAGAVVSRQTLSAVTRTATTAVPGLAVYRLALVPAGVIPSPAAVTFAVTRTPSTLTVVRE
jgi:hypothetical protein